MERLSGLLFGTRPAAWDIPDDTLIAQAAAEQVLSALPFPAHPAVAQARREQAARALALQAQLRELDTLLDAPATLLKGSAALFDLYAGHEGERRLSDIDLLLAPEQVTALTARLRQRGWQSLAGYDNFWHCPAQPLLLPLDLHTEVICSERLGARAWFNAGVDVRYQAEPLPGFARLQVLAPAGAGMVMLVHHLLHHGYRGLKWWHDFHLWWARYPQAREALYVQAPAAWQGAIAFGLWWYARLADSALPAPLADAVRRHQSPLWPGLFSLLWHGPRAAPARYLAAYAFLPTALWARYTRELLMPDTQALRAYYRSDGGVCTLMLRHWRDSIRSYR